MKTPLMIKSLTTIAFALTLPIIAVSADNIFPEGAMTTAGPNGLPEGFAYPKLDWVKSLGAEVTAETEEGINYVRITQPLPIVNSMIWFDAKVPLPPGTSAVRVSGRVRCDTLEMDSAYANKGDYGAGILVTFLSSSNADFTKYSPDLTSMSQVTTAGWKDFEKEAPVPIGADTLYLQMSLRGGTGVVDFANIEVVPVTN